MVALPAQAQKKKTPAKKPTGKSKAGFEKKKKQAMQEALAAQHRTRMRWAYLLGLLSLLLLAFALIPGQSAWLAVHTWLWGFAGICLLPWLAYSFYCCSIWLRNRSLSETWVTLLCQALLIMFFGTTVFILAADKELLASEDFLALAAGSFAHEGQLSNGGFVPGMLGALLAKACGKFPAALISLLLMLASVPLALPPLRELLVRQITGRWGADAPPKPEKEIPVKEPKPEAAPKSKGAKASVSSIDEELAELDRLSREHASPGEKKSRSLFELINLDKPGEAAPERIPTVMELEPLSEDEAAALADNLGPGGGKRKRARQAGDEAAKAAMESLLNDAAHADLGEEDYQTPPISCLAPPRGAGTQPDKGDEDIIARKLVYTLESFGVAVELVGRNRGPAVTRYELRPAEGVKISKITALSDDIALRLAATKVRIEAPIPGKPAVGVEVPNRVRAVVSLRELVDSDTYRAGTRKSKLTVALGKDIVGDLVCADLAKLPHLLIAGTTGSGKSVCMNALILSLMYNASPSDVKLLMVDPKQVEFNVYSGIPHLLVPVVSDPLKAAGALGWAVNEMERRYSRISEQNVRDLDSYNNIAAMQDDLEHMPRIVIFIDELSDLMMVAPGDVEDSIQRIAQKGRAAGMHLVVATQRPSVDVITGVIKSNLPGRIALSVASQIDSRTIINSAGAEQLLGNGDMLFSVNGGNNAVRVQGCYVSDPEVQKVVSFVKKQDKNGEGYDDSVWEEIDRFAAAAARGKKKGGGFDLSGDDGDDDDPMLDAAIEVVVNAQMASTTMLQKKLKLGYARASRVVDLLEAKGIVGPPEGSKPRKVLMSHAQWQEWLAQGKGQISMSNEQ